MTSFVDCNEIVFRGTFVILLCAAFVGVVCFAISLSYRLKLRYVIPELLCALCAVTTFCFLSDGIRIRDFGESGTGFSGSICFCPAWCMVLTSFLLLAAVGVCLALVIKKAVVRAYGNVR
ncbi:MAG: hypothetical protein MR909_01085 [Clostridiales bacterium]|nr:hypothetical protein [Clostridiales bacterium]